MMANPRSFKRQYNLGRDTAESFQPRWVACALRHARLQRLDCLSLTLHTISILPPWRNQFTFVVVVVVANGLRRLDCLCLTMQSLTYASVKERTTSLLLLRMGRWSHPSMHPILTSSEVNASSFNQLPPFPSPKFPDTLNFQWLPRTSRFTLFSHLQIRIPD